MNYFDTDLTTLHEKLVNKEITSEQLTKETLATIKADNDKLNAYITIDEEAALAAAKVLTKKELTQIISGPEFPSSKDNIVTRV